MQRGWRLFSLSLLLNAQPDTYAMPVTVVQQDWGSALGFDAEALWSAWAADLDHVTTDAGHFMAEESPAEISKHLRALLAR